MKTFLLLPISSFWHPFPNYELMNKTVLIKWKLFCSASRSLVVSYNDVLRCEFYLGCGFFRARLHHWIFKNNFKNSVAIEITRAKQAEYLIGRDGTRPKTFDNRSSRYPFTLEVSIEPKLPSSVPRPIGGA